MSEMNSLNDNQSKMKTILKNICICLSLVCFVSFANKLFAQVASAKHRVLIDVAHGQKFWNDPTAMTGMDPNFIARVKYMTAEITKTATSVNADVGYIKSKIKPADLAKCDLLFIHLPSVKYDADEATAINQYVQNGGNLFLVMDADYWSTLAQTNVNAIISPSGITFGTDSPDTLSGGYTKPSPITNKKLKVTYHGGRIVNGGTPFCYNNNDSPFGTFASSGKGKMVVMGDGMVSLYMTSWKDVNDYQCSEFMHDVFAWLLK
jgi:hypothetical protein